MFTYSINEGTTTVATSLASLNDVLGRIPDNSNSQVSPRDIRDVVFTLWNHAGVLKETSVTGSPDFYVGFDYQQTGIGLKRKIYLGKRQFAGFDVMTDPLLQGDTDVFVFNTKPDSANQDSTKVSFLASSDTSLHGSAPYIQSARVASGTQSALDFRLVNQTGDIGLFSQAGHLNLNGVLFPRAADFDSAGNGDVLKYEFDGTQSYLRLLPVNTANLDAITVSGTFSIEAATVLVNGRDINFTRTDPVLVPLGGVAVGSSFSGVPVVDVIDRMLYPYVPPAVSLSITVGSYTGGPSLWNNSSRDVYAETNSLASAYYTYDITPRSHPVASVLQSPGGGNPPTTFSLSGTSSITVPVVSQGFTLEVTDLTQSVALTASVTYVKPYFWAATQSVIDFATPGYFNLMSKVTKPPSETQVAVAGDSVRIYFAYPSAYGDLTAVVDSVTGWNYIGAFEKFYSGNLTSSFPAWATGYNVYRYARGDGRTSLDALLTFRH